MELEIVNFHPKATLAWWDTAKQQSSWKEKKNQFKSDESDNPTILSWKMSEIEAASSSMY